MEKFNIWKKLSIMLGLMLTISFTSWGQCNYTLEMLDSYGDGWNGNTMDVIVNSTVVLDDVTLSSGSSGTMTFTVNTGDNITTVWNGGGSWGSETSYNILDVTGTVVGSGAQTSITTPIVANCPTCPGPTSISAANITGSSMDISWTTAASNSNIEYGPAGFTQGTGTVVYNASNPYTISGLSALTSYDVYVQDSCGATDLSSWIGPYTFNTAVSAPYFEDFETFSTTTGFTSENGWLGVGPGANDIDIVNSLDMGSPYSGSRAVEMNDGAIDSQDTSILVTPPLAGLGNGDKQIKFQGMAEDHAQNELYIGVMTDPYNTATLTILDTITFSASDQWFEIIISLSNSTLIGSAQHIAFVHGPSSYEIGIDDFEYFTPAQNDLSAKAIISPAPVAIEMTNAMTVEMEIYNNGINTQSNYDVSYSIDGGAFVTETVTPSITAGATYAYTFTTTADLSATGNHTITAVVSNTGDTLNGNDTITTTITNEAIPFSDNFDNLIEPYMPVGWNVVNTTSGGYVDSDNYEVYSPPMALDMYNSSADAGEDLILTLPQYFGSLSNKRLNFAAFNEELAEELIIGVMTDPTDGTTFTPVDTANFTAADTWQEFSIDLFSYTGTGEYVAFKHNCSDTYTDIYLDDVSMVAVYNNDLGILAVDAPETVIGQTAPSTVTVQVKNFGLVAQSNFPVSFSVDSGATYTTENITSTLNPGDTMTYTFTGTADLTGGGDFEFIVATGLAADQQSINDTLKPVISNHALPHMENFDNVTIPALPDGWSAITEYSSAYVETDDYQEVSAPNSLDMYNSGGSSGQDLFAVMPAFKGNYSNLALEFDVYTETDSDSLIIGVLSNPTDATTFTGVDTIIYPSDNTHYYDLKVFFFNYTGSGEYIAFKHTSTDSYEDMYFDNVELINIPNDDVGVIAIDQPASGIQLTNSMPVTVQVKNYGLNSQSNIPVKFTSDGGASFITGTVPGPIAFGDTATYTFTSVADLTTPGNLTLHAITDLAADQNNMNDTAMKMINNYSLPYTQNFDNMPLDDLTYDGWSFINETSGYVEVDDYRSTSGPNAIRMNNSGSTGGENLMAIMPGYYGDFNGKWINMDVYTETDTDSLIVGVLTDPTDPATFTGVDTILFPEDNVWASFPAMLSNYSGSGNYIAFRHTSTDSYEDIHIDNVILENAPAGPIFGISPSPIDMGAVRYDHPDTLIKTVEVTNEGTGMLTVTDAVLSVSGAGNFAMIDTNTYPKSLAALETMSLQIKFYGSSVGQVSANLNVTANSVAHTTPVHGEIIDGIINTFPYMETMDHDGNFPFYWKTSATDSYDWNVGTETTSSYTGATMDHTTGTGYFAYTEASGAGTGDTAMMVTPQLDFTTISRPQMSFWYHMHGSDIGTLQIDVAENGTWYNAVATISGEQHANQGDAWMKKNVSLTGFPNADSVRFTAISDGSYEGDISIDDIAFGMAPNVDLPADTGICEGSMLMLDAGYNADWTYEWYLDTMVTVYSTSQNIVADSAAKYYVKVTNGYGFTTVDSMMLTINPIPVVDLTTASGMVYCESAMADTLIGTPAGGTYAGPGVTNNMFHPSVAGTGQHVLYYHYTSPEGCDAMDSMMVYVNPLPAVDAGQDVDVCEGDSVTLTATYNNLFFSEYIEGSSNNKAIEIYNGTGKPVHLDNYAVLTNYNGNPWSGEYTFPSGTVLNDGETYVIANSSANATILAQADETLAYNEKGYMMGYNGDDVRALVQYTPNGDTLILDQIGLYDLIDPGSGWDVAGVTNGTNNQTMVRKAWAGPNLGDWATSAGTDSISSEWYVMPQDDASDLGMHTTNIGNKAYATVSFMWNTGATTPSITVSPASTQTYTVTLTDASGCTNTDEVTVTVNPTPMVDLGADTMFVCAADSAVLTPGNFAAYSWSTGETTSSIVVDSAGIGMGSETYSVSVTDQNGCMGMDSIVVMFVDYPSVTIAGPDTMLYYTGSAILDAGAGYATYNWSNGATTQDIYIDISDVNMGMNTFSVTVTNDYGCAATDTKDVFAQNDLGLEDASDGMDISVYPNPNDGVFTLEINGPNQDFNLEIMNVNGQLIQSEYINADEFSKEYDLSNLAKGVYYIRLMNDDMNKTQKLIIK